LSGDQAASDREQLEHPKRQRPRRCPIRVRSAGPSQGSYRFSPDDYREITALFEGPRPADRRAAHGRGRVVGGHCHATCRRSPRRSHPTTLSEGSPRSPQKLRKDAGLPDEPTAAVAKSRRGAAEKAKS